MSDLVAGIDLATRDARVTVTDAGGTVFATGSAPTATVERPAPGRSEQDATSWWPAVVTALRQATSALGADARHIVAVAPTATSGTVVVVDADQAPIGPALLYDDRRGEDQAAVARAVGARRWADCGLTIDATFALAKLGWLAQAGALAAATHAWSPVDLLVARLSGDTPPTDWSDALKTGYDPLRREWAHEVHAALEIPSRLLPEVRAPGALAGRVSAQAAAETGLPRGCRVHLGMTDGCTAQLASTVIAPGRSVSVLGTTLVIKAVSDRLVHDPDGVVYSHLHPTGLWLPGGASNCGGRSLRGVTNLAALDDAAARRGPARAVRYPLAVDGERFPFRRGDARGFTLGDPVDDAEDHRATLEGVAFVERLAYEHLDRLGAPPAETIVAAGGGSASAVWRRIRATVLGRPVALARHPVSSFGAALLAAAGSLHADVSAAAEAMVHVDAIVEPDPAERDALEDSYQRLLVALRERGWLTAG